MANNYEIWEKMILNSSYGSQSKVTVTKRPSTPYAFQRKILDLLQKPSFQRGDIILCERKKHKPKILVGTIVSPHDEKEGSWVVRAFNKRLDFRVSWEEIVPLKSGVDYEIAIPEYEEYHG